MTGELVHDPWAAHFTGQHHLLQLGSSLGRHTVAPSSWAGRDPVKRNTDILDDMDDRFKRYDLKLLTSQTGESNHVIQFNKNDPTNSY